MAEVTVGGIQPYTIALDSIDLSHLGKYIQSSKEEKTPLWTKKYLNGETEYYQVQIETKDVHEDCYSESTETYKCHICNINVPIMFSKEHNNSEQHETLKNIFQQVLERLSKQINTNIIDIDTNIYNNVYFCVPCSKTIQIKNKLKHELSSCHVKSQQDMSIVKEFYKIFKENEIHSDEDSGHSKSTLNENGDTNNTLFKTCSSISTETLDSDDDEYIDFSMITNNANAMAIPMLNIENQAVVNIESAKQENFEDYLKEMIEKYKITVDLPKIKGQTICLVTPNGSQVNVSSEHYQSYRQINNSVYCQLCKLWISQDTMPHSVTEKHVRHIFSPINENFARTIDNVSSHCVPCNEIILTNSNHHTINDNHKKIIKETRALNTGKTYCDECNIYIDTHNFAVHIISTKHLTVLMLKHSIRKLDNTNNIYYCNICNLNVHMNDLKNHVSSRAHTAKKNNDANIENNKNNNSTKLENKNNNPTKANNANKDSSQVNNKNNDSPAIDVNLNSNYCQICKVKVPGGGMQIHVNGKPHKQVVSELNTKKNNELKTKDNKVNSVKPLDGNSKKNNNSTTSISLPSSNVRSKPSAAKMDEYYKQLIYTNSTKTKVKCKICNNVIINNVECNIIEHMEGRTHVENTNLKMNKYNKLLLYTNAAKTNVDCIICDVNIPYVDRNVIEHMEGSRHIAAEESLLKYHAIKREPNEFVCECCKIKTTNYLEHINSKEHTLQYLKNYDIDKNEMRKYVYENDEKGPGPRQYRELYKNLLKHNNILKTDDFNYYCSMCDIKMGRISEVDHVLGVRHNFELHRIK